MCQVPSWIEQENGTVLFLTDKDAIAHKIDWQDATGHTAIRRVYPNAKRKDCEGLGKHTPKEVVRAIKAGALNRIAAAGEVVIVDGKWKLPLTKCDRLSVNKGATVTLPALTKKCSELCVYVYEGATANLPALTKCGELYVREKATANLPALTTCGELYVREKATVTLPALTKCGELYVDGTLNAPKLERG